MASNSGLLFINKAIQAEDFNTFARYGLTEESFVSAIDRQTYRFIEEYVDKNGQMPSYAMVADNVPEFTYIPDISDRFEPLARGVNERKLAVEFNRYFEYDFEDLKDDVKGNADELISQMTDDLSQLRLRYSSKRKLGVDLKKDTELYMDEYRKRQDGESFKTWNSFMPFLNDEIGGYSSGNMYVYYGQSGRGKSAIVLRDLLEMAQQGATVLLWSLEMPGYEVLTRLYTMLSAKLGKTTIDVSGEFIPAGFDSRELRNGQLADDFEASFQSMLDEIHEHVDGTIIIRGVDDRDFAQRDVKQLISDIEATNADVVAVDPMYYMQFERNTSKTAGGDASETSKKLRRLAGSQDVVVIAMTQADEDEEKQTDGVRELKLPPRAAVKKTKSLLEDATTLIAIDTDYKQSRGIVGINKGRNGGEGETCELTFLPNYGIIEQVVIESGVFADF